MTLSRRENSGLFSLAQRQQAILFNLVTPPETGKQPDSQHQYCNASRHVQTSYGDGPGRHAGVTSCLDGRLLWKQTARNWFEEDSAWSIEISK